MKFGYARVSSNTQDHAAQVEALKAAGCERIYSEKASGKSTNGRPEFAKLMKALKPGDASRKCQITTSASRSSGWAA
jgi:DNA invertase Pin-like site-specific DNA recombinase